MRNLFICFLLATLVAVAQSGPTPVVEPATYLGVLVVFPVICARLFRNRRLPPAVGAIAAGVLLNQSGLLNADILQNVAPFKAVGFVWLGLYLGTQIARPTAWKGPNAASAIAIVVSCTLLICLGTALLPLTLLERLQIGLAGAVCAPIFTMLEPGRHRDEIGLTGLATVLAILLFALTATLSDPVRPDTTILLAGGVGLLLSSEVAFQSLKSAASGPGRYLVCILMVGAVWRAAMGMGFHPAALGVVFGAVLGLRARRRRDITVPLEEASAFVGPFVIGFVTAAIDWSRVLDAPPEAWWVGVLIVGPMVVGKAIAGAAAGELTRFGHRRWLTSYPVGVAAIELFPVVIPERLFLGIVAHPDAGVLPTILLGTVVVPLAVGWISQIGVYVASRRNAAAASGGMGLT